MQQVFDRDDAFNLERFRDAGADALDVLQGRLKRKLLLRRHCFLIVEHSDFRGISGLRRAPACRPARSPTIGNVQNNAKPDIRGFSLRERLLIAVVSRASALLIAAVGATLRFTVIAEEGAAPAPLPASGIYCFWHQCTFSAGWYFRKYNACILISRSLDGELIARTLGRLGFRSVRGSSSRGAVAGLLALRQEVQAGGLAIFTADGPRGPAYRAKLGPVKLAQRTGRPLGCFHLEPERAWTLRSWDGFRIPKPGSRVVVSWARSVPPATPHASESELETTRAALDEALERARTQAIRYLGREQR